MPLLYVPLLYVPLPRMDTAQLTLVRQPFDHPDFLYEIKHDGFRALAYISDGQCELICRRPNSYKSFHNLRGNLAKLKVENAIIDDEIVCLDAEGRSIFNELLFRRGYPVFYAFDLLYLNGRDLRQLPLIGRKEKLRAIIEKSGLTEHWKSSRALEIPVYELFYEGEQPPKVPNVLRRKSSDDNAWGSVGKDARYLSKLCRALTKIDEGNRELLLHMVQKMSNQ